MGKLHRFSVVLDMYLSPGAAVQLPVLFQGEGQAWKNSIWHRAADGFGFSFTSLDMEEDSAGLLIFRYFKSLCLRGTIIQESGRHAIKAGNAFLSRDQTLSRLVLCSLQWAHREQVSALWSWIRFFHQLGWSSVDLKWKERDSWCTSK